jgi:nucleotide-binding universal stress UspA family protein
MFRKILIAYDGSPGAERALRAGLDLARRYEAEAWALAVEEQLPHFATALEEVDERPGAAAHYYRRRLDLARQRAAEVGVDLKTAYRTGHPAKTIVDFAREGNFDLIVLGHSGHSGVWAMFLGMTAEKVSRHAHCSVLIVR